MCVSLGTCKQWRWHHLDVDKFSELMPAMKHSLSISMHHTHWFQLWCDSIFVLHIIAAAHQKIMAVNKIKSTHKWNGRRQWMNICASVISFKQQLRKNKNKKCSASIKWETDRHTKHVNTTSIWYFSFFVFNTHDEFQMITSHIYFATGFCCCVNRLGKLIPITLLRAINLKPRTNSVA